MKSSTNLIHNPAPKKAERVKASVICLTGGAGFQKEIKNNLNKNSVKK